LLNIIDEEEEEEEGFVSLTPVADVIKLITAYVSNFRNKLERLLLTSLSSLV
jgi:hypothetical protein